MSGQAVVLLSGGLDSSTLLYLMLSRGERCTALAVNYGQRHSRELEAAQRLAAAASVPFICVQASVVLQPVFAKAASSQVGRHHPVPHGHYAAPNMAVTIVPNRNMLLLSIAGALASSIGADKVAYAAHAGDHPIYPDCRPEFIEACRQTLELGCGVRLIAPFSENTKTDIARAAGSLGVPAGLTYSCYEGRERHCGLCGTCVERREAFRDAGVPDPTVYEVGVTS